MRSLAVVHFAPLIESILAIGVIGKAARGEHFGLERAMEAFFLALSLRMGRSAMQQMIPRAGARRPKPLSVLPGQQSPQGEPLSVRIAAGMP